MFLFDLSVDPFESTNVYSDSAYSVARSELEERFDFFQGSARESEKAVKPVAQVWKKAGGVVPYIDAAIPAKQHVESSSPVKGAPNFLFLLMDDVGLNDVSYENSPSSYMEFATPHLKALAKQGIRLTSHYTAWVCG